MGYSGIRLGCTDFPQPYSLQENAEKRGSGPQTKRCDQACDYYRSQCKHIAVCQVNSANRAIDQRYGYGVEDNDGPVRQADDEQAGR